MSRYYTPVTTQPEKPWLQSLAILGALGLGIGIIGATLCNEFTNR